MCNSFSFSKALTVSSQLVDIIFPLYILLRFPTTTTSLQSIPTDVPHKRIPKRDFMTRVQQKGISRSWCWTIYQQANGLFKLNSWPWKSPRTLSICHLFFEAFSNWRNGERYHQWMFSVLLEWISLSLWKHTYSLLQRNLSSFHHLEPELAVIDVRTMPGSVDSDVYRSWPGWG